MLSGFESEFPVDLLGRYRLIGEIGAGSMGVVFHAVDTSLEKDVAIKTLYRGTGDHRKFMRFQKEAKAIGRLEHPNIVRVLDFGVTKSAGGAYMVMDFVEGKSLNAFMNEESCASEIATILHIFRQICIGIQHAHQNGVIHRDLKATNIMVEMKPEQPPTVRIIDFGVAQLIAVDERVGFESTGTIMGSPAYMSPESSRGEGDARSDIYSLGCVLFECVTGRIPFVADSNLEAARLHSEAPPPRLRDLIGAYNEDWCELQNLLDKCMAKSAHDRYQNVEELIEAVEKVAESILDVQLSSGLDEQVTQVSQSISMPLWKFYPKSRKAKERGALLTAAAALLIGIVVTALLWNNEESAEQRRAAFAVGQRTSEEVSGKKERVEWVNKIVRSATGSSHHEWNDQKIATMKRNSNPNLDLRDSDVTNIGIKKLKTVPLRTADLSWSAVTDEGVIALAEKSPTIMILKLDGLKVGDAAIEKITSLPLVVLALRDSDVSDKGLEMISSIKTLTRVRLDSCRQITDDGIKHLGNLPVLSDVGLSSTPITTCNLTGMKNLEQLFIGHIPCNDTQLETLSSLAHLRYLDITAADITGKSISSFLKFPRLEWVGVANCRRLNLTDRQRICTEYLKRWGHPLVLEDQLPYSMSRAVHDAYAQAGIIEPSRSR